MDSIGNYSSFFVVWMLVNVGEGINLGNEKVHFSREMRISCRVNG